MRVGIDIDSTTCDLVPSIVDMANERLGTNYTVKDVDKWDYVFEGANGDRCRLTKLIGEAFAIPGFLESLPAIEGACEGVEAISRIDGAGDLSITFITNRHPRHAYGTIRWLHEHIGEYPVIFAKDAKQHGLDILIDDAPHHIENFSGRLPIVYDQPWNQRMRVRDQGGILSNKHYRKVMRVKSWPQIVSIMEGMYWA